MSSTTRNNEKVCKKCLSTFAQTAARKFMRLAWVKWKNWLANTLSINTQNKQEATMHKWQSTNKDTLNWWGMKANGATYLTSIDQSRELLRRACAASRKRRLVWWLSSDRRSKAQKMGVVQIMQKFDTQEHQGWTNYDTFLVNCWLFNNNECVYNCSRMIVNTDRRNAVQNLKDFAIVFEKLARFKTFRVKVI